MIIGYARVSTRDQHLDLQADSLKHAACKRIYQDVASGAKTVRPALDKLLDQLRAGDVLVIWKLDRMGRSLKHLVELLGNLMARKVGLLGLFRLLVDIQGRNDYPYRARRGSATSSSPGSAVRRSAQPTAIAVTAPELLHAFEHVDQHLVEGVDADESQAWVLDVDDDVHRQGHARGKADHVEPAARLGGGHAVAGEQCGNQRQSVEQHEDDHGGVHRNPLNLA